MPGYWVVRQDVEFSIGTAGEEAPADEDDEDDDQTGSDDSGDSGSGNGQSDSTGDTSTDSAGSDSSTGSGGDNATDDVASVAPSPYANSTSGGNESATSSRSTTSEGAADTTLSGGSNASGATPTFRAEELAQMGTVYKVGTSDIDVLGAEDEKEGASPLQVMQLEVYGIPLLILLLGILFFSAAPAGILGRLGLFGFGSKHRSRLS